ncbi:DNA gyrase inhibitor YacG [Primorskyibacter sp. S87]|uniref:DNA gyrase inhibitor YacG n=1 Tax=Primorskyibacter sp. S87 TaxID=3415126 RepID=UPI003C799033
MSCPTCGQKTVANYRPFCCRRCADLDLAKWLNGSYALPSEDHEEVEAPASPEEFQRNRPH